MDVLIVYATKHGSTRQVTEAIAGAMRDHGASVELGDYRSGRPVTGRDLVVVGGALYSGRWHRGARRFLARNRRDQPVDTDARVSDPDVPEHRRTETRRLA